MNKEEIKMRLAGYRPELYPDDDPEIAEAMELSVEAVESLTARGKRSLKALLSGMQEKLGLV